MGWSVTMVKEEWNKMDQHGGCNLVSFFIIWTEIFLGTQGKWMWD